MIPPGSEGDRGVFGFKRKASENLDAPREDGSEDEDEEGALKECGAGFRTNQQLKRHMESHMKTMPHIVSYVNPLQIKYLHVTYCCFSSVQNIHHAQPDLESVGHYVDISARFT